jgi:cytochrome P450
MSTGHQSSPKRLPTTQIRLHLPTRILPGVRTFHLTSDKMLSKRQALGATRKDILPNSLASDVETGARFTQEHLSANAITLVVAGSVTASTALTQIFRMLALNNEIVAES